MILYRYLLSDKKQFSDANTFVYTQGEGFF